MQREGRPISTMLPKALREILVVIGLSVLLPYFRGYFLSPVKTAGIHPTSVLEHAFLAFAVSFVACAVLVLVAGPRALQAARSRWVTACCRGGGHAWPAAPVASLGPRGS